MIYMLDTNACIQHLRNRASAVGLKLQEKWRDKIVISAITEFELYHGALGSREPQLERAKVKDFLLFIETISFEKYAAQLAGELRFELEKKGQMIGPFDLQIAATAITHKAILVTHNVSEFSRVPHLVWEDWEKT